MRQPSCASNASNRASPGRRANWRAMASRNNERLRPNDTRAPAIVPRAASRNPSGNP